MRRRVDAHTRVPLSPMSQIVRNERQLRSVAVAAGPRSRGVRRLGVADGGLHPPGAAFGTDQRMRRAKGSAPALVVSAGAASPKAGARTALEPASVKSP